MPKKIWKILCCAKVKRTPKRFAMLGFSTASDSFECNWTLLVISIEPKIWVFWDQMFMACITFGVFEGKSYGLTTCLLTKWQDGEEFWETYV
jgi:hypothetical protein